MSRNNATQFLIEFLLAMGILGGMMSIVAQVGGGILPESKSWEVTFGFHKRGDDHWHSNTAGATWYSSGTNNVENPFAARAERGGGNPGDNVEFYSIADGTETGKGSSIDFNLMDKLRTNAQYINALEFRKVRDGNLALEVYTTNDPANPIKTLVKKGDFYVGDGRTNGGKVQGPISRVLAKSPGLKASAKGNAGSHMVLSLRAGTLVYLQQSSESFALLETNTLTAKMYPPEAASEVTNYIYEISFEEKNDWHVLASTNAPTYDWIGRVAGDGVTLNKEGSGTIPKFELRVTAQIASQNIQSDPIVSSVTFPSYEDVKKDPDVDGKLNDLWDKTKQFTKDTTNQVRELGMNVYIDTSKEYPGYVINKGLGQGKKFFEGPVETGRFFTNHMGVDFEELVFVKTNTFSVNIATPLDKHPSHPNTNAFYLVTLFHSHPFAANYREVTNPIYGNIEIILTSFPIGPSKKDIAEANTNAFTRAGVWYYDGDNIRFPGGFPISIDGKARIYDYGKDGKARIR